MWYDSMAERTLAQLWMLTWKILSVELVVAKAMCVAGGLEKVDLCVCVCRSMQKLNFLASAADD